MHYKLKINTSCKAEFGSEPRVKRRGKSAAERGWHVQHAGWVRGDGEARPWRQRAGKFAPRMRRSCRENVPPFADAGKQQDPAARMHSRQARDLCSLLPHLPFLALLAPISLRSAQTFASRLPQSEATALLADASAGRRKWGLTSLWGAFWHR